MKYGNHANSCNGPGDCSCGVDYREFAARAVDSVIESNKEKDKLYSNPTLLRKKAAELIKEAKALEKMSRQKETDV